MSKRNVLFLTVLTLAACWFCAFAEDAEDPVTETDPAPFVDGSFTIAVLPDTQGYAESFPEIFDAQTGWIAENAKTRNIAFVLQLGDITDDNVTPQWDVVKKAMAKLDGAVPYAVSLGNHDFGLKGRTDTRDTFFNTCFPLSEQKVNPAFGGVFDGEPESLNNSYHLFSAGGRDFIVLALEFGPRNAVVDWANRVLKEHPDRWAILITHAYLYSDDTRYDWPVKGTKQLWNPHSYPVCKATGDCNDGEELWEKLVSKYPKMLLVVNGHVLHDGLGKLTSTGDAGNVVHQILVNFQMKPKAGGGFMRLLEFLPDGKTIQVKDFSPFTKQYKTGPDHVFTLAIPAP